MALEKQDCRAIWLEYRQQGNWLARCRLAVKNNLGGYSLQDYVYKVNPSKVQHKTAIKENGCKTVEGRLGKACSADYILHPG